MIFRSNISISSFLYFNSNTSTIFYRIYLYFFEVLLVYRSFLYIISKTSTICYPQISKFFKSHAGFFLEYIYIYIYSWNLDGNLISLNKIEKLLKKYKNQPTSLTLYKIS